MRTRLNTTFPSIRTEGVLLPADLLQRIAAFDSDLGGFQPEAYGLPPNERLNEAINHAWKRMQGFWASFSKLIDAGTGAGAGGPTLSQTRERWLLPLFDQLGFGRLSTARAIEIDDKRYPISHGWQQVPLHLLAWGTDLDHRSARTANAEAAASPHALLQELLNRSPEHLWGVMSNGAKLRLLRDNARLTRQAYLEFDLEQMMRGESYADFALLWLVCHASRVETKGEGRVASGESATPLAARHAPSPDDCWLEKWSQAAQTQGTRALEFLRNGVQAAISALGQGFLSHPGNAALREALTTGALDKQDFYRELLRVVYRLLFVFVAEERDLLLTQGAKGEGRVASSSDDPPLAIRHSLLAPPREIYTRFYSFRRLRELASKRSGTRHTDLWQTAMLVLGKLGDADGVGCPELALPALGGFLFSASATVHLNGCKLSNQHFLDAIRALSFTDDGQQRRAVDYKHLGSEELGSVYESLLELQPHLNLNAGTFELTSVAGSERKTTGSYYTRSDLVDALLDSALEPVVGARLERAKRVGSGEWRVVGSEVIQQYGDQVLSRFAGVATRDGHRGTGISTHAEVPTRGDVRPNLADASGGNKHSGQSGGGLGARDNQGVSALHSDRQWQSARAGDPSHSGPAGQASDTRADSTHLGAVDHAQPPTYGITAQPLEAQQFAERWRLTPLATRYSLFAEQELLKIRVCDAACGSGHFLIAAAHRLAKRLAIVRSGEDSPSPLVYQAALRDVISHCIYGVDINPMSVELCKVSLWMETLQPGKPLSFLDHHIQCGNSLIGAPLPGEASSALQATATIATNAITRRDFMATAN